MGIRERSDYMTGHGGLRLFFRVWEPEEPTGSLVLVHGVNEHTGRYHHVARFFAERGMAVYGLDHRGHGRSEGVRCYVERFEDYLHDLRQMVDLASIHGKPLMLGHSLGGLISFRYGLAYPETIAALILSSPYFQLKLKVNPIERMAAPLLAKLLPRLQLPGKLPARVLCRNPEVVKAYEEDPYIHKGVTPRWFMESERVRTELYEGAAAQMRLPVLFLQSGDDHLVDPEGTRAVYEALTHSRKAFRLYPEAYHELLNDPGYEAILLEIVNWLKEQELTAKM
jgi:alpha-beta hydrolase superfamily lysophospholipase